MLVVFVFLNRIIEVFFRLSLKFRDNGDKVIRLYRRVVRLLTIASNDKLLGYTPEMIREYLVKRRGVELGGLIDLLKRPALVDMFLMKPSGKWSMQSTKYNGKSSQSVRKLLWSLIRICNEMAVRKNHARLFFV